eukprot:TRINITY_DN3102_c0_g1_i2.p1 TRINITY_DN3102_c0_g1~~TRINITY_DN3102_c0_g1_i2.p1  ORF type:complete len:365 (+),score=128.59 TRINITY_DN3102_c0_g1_i2:165-1259(+)
MSDYYDSIIVTKPNREIESSHFEENLTHFSEFSTPRKQNASQNQNEEEGESLHDEFMTLMRNNGMESIAKEAGVIKNGSIPSLREYNQSSRSKDSSNLVGNVKREEESASFSAGRDRKHRISSLNGSDSQDSNNNEINIETVEVNEVGPYKKRKKGSKAADDSKSKGLRHFSLKVCEKVEQKKTTTYNEVADELVIDLQKEKEGPVDEKNIRRRVYDALNVLMAMNIIAKDKKEIRWIGSPTNSKMELEILKGDLDSLIQRIKKKQLDNYDLEYQHKAYSSLLERNNQHQLNHQKDPQNVPPVDPSSQIYLPFIIVNTKNTTVIECEVSDDRSAYFFNFNLPFELHDDSEILKRMGFMNTTQPT